MSEALSFEELTNPAPYIEQAMQAKPEILDRVKSGELFNDMDKNSPAADSAVCQQLSMDLLSSIPFNGIFDEEHEAMLHAMDGAWRVANALPIVGIPRFSASPESAHLSALDQAEAAVNDALAYIAGHSESALDVFLAAKPHLDPNEKHPMSTYIGFALGLLLVNYGEAEKASEDRMVQLHLEVQRKYCQLLHRQWRSMGIPPTAIASEISNTASDQLFLG